MEQLLVLHVAVLSEYSMSMAMLCTKKQAIVEQDGATLLAANDTKRFF